MDSLYLRAPRLMRALLLAGLAGVCYAARYGSISSGAGRDIELQAVGAAVIGGVAIFGGVGTVWGAAIGAVLLTTINSSLPILGVSDFWQRAVVGAHIESQIQISNLGDGARWPYLRRRACHPRAIDARGAALRRELARGAHRGRGGDRGQAGVSLMRRLLNPWLRVTERRRLAPNLR